jgi:hypothetical protein
MRYTKSDLERIVLVQLENLTAMEELLRLMNAQNELIQKANQKLQSDLQRFNKKHYALAVRKRAVETKTLK